MIETILDFGYHTYQPLHTLPFELAVHDQSHSHSHNCHVDMFVMMMLGAFLHVNEM